MTSALNERRRWTVEEYLAFDATSHLRNEFIDGEVYAMSGGSISHSIIQSNVNAVLYNQLENTDCLVLTGDMRVQLSPYQYGYPDAAVVCEPPNIEPLRGVDTLTNPVVIVEVLSPSTERRDRGSKFTGYQTIETLRHYVLIAQDAPQVECYTRADDGRWNITIALNLDSSITLDAIGCTLDLARIYRQIQFTPGALANASLPPEDAP